MNVLILGAKERDSEEDRALVGELLKRVIAEAPHTVFVSAVTHIGVGRYVKEACLEKKQDGKYRYALVECNTRIYAHDLSKSDASHIYLARNATPCELSDFLIYLANEEQRGTGEEAIERFVAAGKPVLILKPGDKMPEKIIGAGVCQEFHT